MQRKRFLKKIFGDHRLEGCPIPLAVTAVDLESGREVIFETGPMVEAITASTAIPGVFNPVYLDGHYLVDGGLLEDSPILSLRRSGQCDLIIGTRIVDNASRQFISGMIYHKYLKKGRFTPQKIGQKIQAAWGQLSADTQLMFQIIFRSITIVREELFQYSVKEAKPDLFLEFEMSDVEIFQFEKFQEMITKGEQKMDQQITHLLGLLKEMQPQQVQDKE